MSNLTGVGADAAAMSSTNNDDESEQNESESGDYGEFERFDLSSVDGYGMQHPPTAIRGEAVALRRLYDEDDPDRADVAVILDDPAIETSESALEHTVIVESDDESDDYKIVNLSDDDTAAISPSGKIEDPSEIDDYGDLLGVDFDSNGFYGDVSQVFADETGRIAHKRGGSAGMRITRTLDVNGAQSARPVRDDDGELVLHDGGFPETTGGLVEWDNRNIDDTEPPRYARDQPELRPDVEGREVIILVQRLAKIDPEYDGNSYWATVLANLPDERAQDLTQQYAHSNEDADPADFVEEYDGETFVRLEPTAEFEPTDGNRTSHEWNWPDWTEINERRLDEGFDVYVPDGRDESEVTP